MSKLLNESDALLVRNAVLALLTGSLVAFPTETVYGLGADACNEDAVGRIFSVKNRPKDHPLIVHIASVNSLDDWAVDVPPYAIELALKYWPGPMTLVMRRSELADDFITGGQDTVGLRVPNHPIALGILEDFAEAGGKGVAAPSANRFGQVSPTTSEAVKEELGTFLAETDLILDGGPSVVGLESTIIDCTREVPRILRPGAITQSMIEEITELKVFGSREEPTFNSEDDAIRVSGSLENHYAPKADVFLDQQPIAGSGFIALESLETPPGVIRLAAPKTVEEFARTLYSSLREGDHQELDAIYIEQPIGDGLAIAIRDRLSRSAKNK